MGRQGGQGKGKPKLKDRNFGKALIKSQTKGHMGTNGRQIQSIPNLSSILDTSNLEDYVLCADMADDGVEVHRVRDNDTFLIEPTVNNTIQELVTKEFDYDHLTIPRKPSWTREMTADDVDRREKDAFLEWRREIAIMETASQDKRVTPFEKNIEVWRQLWRVIEKSDIAIQIVDARNPLMYYTQDLLKYASEQKPSRPMMLLLNKADFLTEYQRQSWAKYFDSIGVRFIFYSAFNEQEKLDKLAASINWEALQREGEFDMEETDMLIDDLALQLKKKKMTIPSNTIGKKENDYDYDDQLVWGGNDKANDNKKAASNSNDSDYNSNRKEKENDSNSYNEEVEDDDDDYEDCEDDDEEENENDDYDENDNDDNNDDNDDKKNNDGKIGHDAESERILSGKSSHVQAASISEKFRLRSRVLTRRELIYLLSTLPSKLNIEPQSRHEGRICVGMLGYPNVGKSSCINTIKGVSKSIHGLVRVAVSSTPGKTKHFQTIIIDESLMLCDCPGLVFPSFMRSAGEMLCAGILPINHMRDYIEPGNVIASRVPMHLLEAAYGMKIKREIDFKDNPNRPPNAHEMLYAYCAIKGYITNGTGRWDEFRACKDMLRDFADGRILYVSPPQHEKDMDRWLSDTEKTMLKREKVAERIALQKLQESDESVRESQKEPASEMVFGDWTKKETINDTADDEADELASNLSDFSLEDTTTITDGGGESTKREHKRLKHWGKKNKKLRDKDPYGDKETGYVSYTAYTTNRTAGGKGGGKPASSDKDNRVRQNPKIAYGKSFVRPTVTGLDMTAKDLR